MRRLFVLAGIVLAVAGAVTYWLWPRDELAAYLALAERQGIALTRSSARISAVPGATHLFTFDLVAISGAGERHQAIALNLAPFDDRRDREWSDLVGPKRIAALDAAISDVLAKAVEYVAGRDEREPVSISRDAWNGLRVIASVPRYERDGTIRLYVETAHGVVTFFFFPEETTRLTEAIRAARDRLTTIPGAR